MEEEVSLQSKFAAFHISSNKFHISSNKFKKKMGKLLMGKLLNIIKNKKNRYRKLDKTLSHPHIEEEEEEEEENYWSTLEDLETLNNYEIDDNYVCEICFESRPLDNSFGVKNCSHLYCIDCTVKYIRSKLDKNETHITCPEANCRGLLDPQFCREILPTGLFNRWEKAQGKSPCESAVNEIDDNYVCEICVKSRPLDDSFGVKGCSHFYCIDCTVNYITYKLHNNETHITCPEANCQGLLDPDFCREILPVDLFERWGNALCESAVNEIDDDFFATYEIDDDYVCEICVESRPLDDSFGVNGCSHFYCIDCTVKYITSKLDNNETRITCPEANCQGLLDPDFCQEILPTELFKRWGKALCESAVNGSEKFYCPYSDCSSLLIKDPLEVLTELPCPACKRHFCVQCKVAWHSGMDCTEFQKLKTLGIDGMLVDLAKKKKWMQCPKCKIHVEKITGCNYIKCRCGYAFCYNCGTPSSGTSHRCSKCNY